MGMAVVNFHHAYSCCGDTLQQLRIPVCMACVDESYSRVAMCIGG